MEVLMIQKTDDDNIEILDPEGKILIRLERRRGKNICMRIRTYETRSRFNHRTRKFEVRNVKQCYDPGHSGIKTALGFMIWKRLQPLMENW